MLERDPITEIVREYGGMEAAGGGAAVFSTYPTMSSRYGDFARDNQQQQTSAAFSQRRTLLGRLFAFTRFALFAHESDALLMIFAVLVRCSLLIMPLFRTCDRSRLSCTTRG